MTDARNARARLPPMKIDATLGKDLDATATEAAALEADGYDALWVGETNHEPFLQLVRAADATQRITIGTSVAIAFARTPMITALAAYDLQRYSGGRFVLGLGSQIKPHIEKRFSMPWSRPAARMREYVLALRAIWDSWEKGSKLDFRGDFYTHTLMTPFFAPEAVAGGRPPVYLAGVGERMTEVAGEVAEGFFIHPFSTQRYLREVTLPALQRGRVKAGRTGLEGFEIGGPAFVCTGRDEAELAEAKRGTRAQIAFYASTPAYKPVLDVHGWGDLQAELNTMTKQGRWSELGDVIDDQVLQAFAAVGDPEEVGRELHRRYGDVATRISFYVTYKSDPSVWPRVLDAVRADSAD